MGQDEKDEQLQPPAFPSGMSGDDAGSDLGDALISPDAPIERQPRLDDAFISPDAPIVREGPVQTPDDFERVMHRDEEDDAEPVVVTGIGAEHAAAGHDEPMMDPYLERVVIELEALVGALRRKGEAGLRTEPDMTRFESTLRGYCVGYLAALKDSALEAEQDHEFD